MRPTFTALVGATALITGALSAPALAQSTEELKAQVRELTERVNEIENRGHVNLPSGTTLTFGGYAKLDMIYDFDQGQGDTALVSGLVPGAPSDGGFRAHVRQSRLNFRTDTQTEKGPLTTFVEIDFFGTRGNEVLSNSHQPRLRHAYGQWNGWTAGQTWSTFMPIELHPNTVDFQGPTGATFIRQALLRYTFPAGENFKIALALENSEFSGRGVNSMGAIVGVGQSTGSAFAGVNAGFDTLPDFVASGTWSHNGSTVKGSVVLRELEAPTALGGDSDTGWGINLGAGTPLWEGGRVAGSFVYGDGIGRYIIDGVGQDAFIDATGRLNTIEAYGGNAQITHKFSDKVSIGLTYGYYEVEDTFTLTDTKQLQTVHASLFWSPVKRMTVGAEINWGERELANGATADATRLQTSVQFNF